VFDQRTLVIVAKPGLLLKIAGTEVVAAIDHIVRTLTQLQQARHQVGENSLRLLIAGIRRQRRQVQFHLQQKIQALFLVLQLLRRTLLFTEQIETGQQGNRRALGNRPNLHPAFAENPGEKARTERQQWPQEVREVAAGNAEIAGGGGAIDQARA